MLRSSLLRFRVPPVGSLSMGDGDPLATFILRAQRNNSSSRVGGFTHRRERLLGPHRRLLAFLNQSEQGRSVSHGEIGEELVRFRRKQRTDHKADERRVQRSGEKLELRT